MAGLKPILKGASWIVGFGCAVVVTLVMHRFFPREVGPLRSCVLFLGTMGAVAVGLKRLINMYFENR